MELSKNNKIKKLVILGELRTTPFLRKILKHQRQADIFRKKIKVARYKLNFCKIFNVKI